LYGFFFPLIILKDWAVGRFDFENNFISKLYHFEIVVSMGRGRFPKVYGDKNNFSMLVQDSLPIDTTISKC
jgi:hypothetical protein